MTAGSRAPDNRRLAGLDAIRFVCAYAVLMSHTPSLWRLIDSQHPKAVLAAKAMRDGFNGAAAVIVFFVISGFCIHYPNRTAAPAYGEYFIRRYVRIGVPLIALQLMLPFFGEGVTTVTRTVTWSLYCELIYYTLYPLLLYAAARLRWLPLIALGLVVAAGRAIIWPEPYGNYVPLHVPTAWITGLPCWMMGCALAERVPRAPVSSAKIWAARVGVWLASVAALELRFHAGVGFDLSLNLFAILATCWLAWEIDYYRVRRPWAWLESVGRWSYSLYLFHIPGQRVVVWLLPNVSDFVRWCVRVPITLLVCYLFFLAFERPSHHLARFLGTRFQQRRFARSSAAG